MPFTTDISKQILDFYFGKKNSNQLTSVSKLYLALCDNDPEESGGTVSELSGNGYERVFLSTKTSAELPNYLSEAGVNPATAEETKNDTALIERVGENYKRGIYNKNEIHFNKATAAWGTVNGFAIYNAETSGTLVYYAKLDNPITVGVDEIAMFDPGELIISFATKDADVESST